MLGWILLSFFFAKTPNKRELREIAQNHSSDISTKYFVNIYKECTGRSYYFFTSDTTLASDNPLRSRNIFF